MKTYRVQIWVLLIMLIGSLSGGLSAGIDISAGITASDRLDGVCLTGGCVSSLVDGGVSSPNVTFGFESDYAVIDFGTAFPLDLDYFASELTLSLAEAGPVTVVYTGESVKPVSLEASAGSFALVVFGLGCWLLVRNFARLYSFLVRGLRNGYAYVIYLPGRMAGFVAGRVADDTRLALVQVSQDSDVIPACFNATTGFAGLLKKLAGSNAAGSDLDINTDVKNTAQQNRFCCAVFIALGAKPAGVFQWLFWESIKFRRSVIRYSIERLGRVRLAANGSGSGMLNITKSRPDFCKSFAVSLPAMLTGSPLLRGYIVCSEQTDSYLSVYQSRKLPLFNLSRSLLRKKLAA